MVANDEGFRQHTHNLSPTRSHGAELQVKGRRGSLTKQPMQGEGKGKQGKKSNENKKRETEPMPVANLLGAECGAVLLEKRAE